MEFKMQQGDGHCIFTVKVNSVFLSHVANQEDVRDYGSHTLEYIIDFIEQRIITSKKRDTKK